MTMPPEVALEQAYRKRAHDTARAVVERCYPPNTPESVTRKLYEEVYFRELYELSNPPK